MVKRSCDHFIDQLQQLVNLIDSAKDKLTDAEIDSTSRVLVMVNLFKVPENKQEVGGVNLCRGPRPPLPLSEEAFSLMAVFPCCFWQLNWRGVALLRR